MNYLGTIIRPPSEANSIILQVSLGCFHNACTFCGAYIHKKFSVKDEHIILADIKYAAKKFLHKNTVFLSDGDALALPFRLLEQILQAIKKYLPWVKRVNSYTSASALLKMSEKELERLQALGLNRLYLGVETGSEKTLRYINKGVTASQMIIAGQKAVNAGFFLSTSVILGLAQKEYLDAAKKTGELLSEIAPHHIAVLSLILVNGTILFQQESRKDFTVAQPNDILRELKCLIEYITIDRVLFHANHASNHLALSGKLPRDRKKLITSIDRALLGETPLMPEYMRSL